MRNNDDARFNLPALLTGGALAAALASTLCCVVPFALFSLGLTTVWIGRMTALAPYQPVAIALALAFIAIGYIKMGRKQTAESCEPGTLCASPASNWLNRVGLWTSAAVVAGALAFNVATNLLI